MAGTYGFIILILIDRGAADIHLPDDLINAPTLLSAHVPGSESALPALPDAGAVPDLPHSSYPGRSMEPSDAAISFPQR